MLYNFLAPVGISLNALKLWKHDVSDGTLMQLLIELGVLLESPSICSAKVCVIILNFHLIKPPSRQG